MTDHIVSAGVAIRVLGPYGVTRKRLRLWCEAGYVGMEHVAKGYGNHRMFTVKQVIGIAVAARTLDTMRGCRASWVGNIVAKITNTKLLPKYLDEVNVHEVAEDIMQSIERIRKKQRFVGPGRRCAV